MHILQNLEWNIHIPRNFDESIMVVVHVVLGMK